MERIGAGMEWPDVYRTVYAAGLDSRVAAESLGWVGLCWLDRWEPPKCVTITPDGGVLFEFVGPADIDEWRGDDVLAKYEYTPSGGLIVTSINLRTGESVTGAAP